MEILVWILSGLLVCYIVSGWILSFNPELMERIESNEKVWAWLLAPVILVSAAILFLFYCVIWLFGGDPTK